MDNLRSALVQNIFQIEANIPADAIEDLKWKYEKKEEEKRATGDLMPDFAAAGRVLCWTLTSSSSWVSTSRSDDGKPTQRRA